MPAWNIVTEITPLGYNYGNHPPRAIIEGSPKTRYVSIYYCDVRGVWINPLMAPRWCQDPLKDWIKNFKIYQTWKVYIMVV